MLRLKKKNEEKKAAESAAAPDIAEGKSDEPVATATGTADEKKEIKLFNSIGGVALRPDSEVKSGRQITPGELRIQRGKVLLERPSESTLTPR